MTRSSGVSSCKDKARDTASPTKQKLRLKSTSVSGARVFFTNFANLKTALRSQDNFKKPYSVVVQVFNIIKDFKCNTCRTNYRSCLSENNALSIFWIKMVHITQSISFSTTNVSRIFPASFEYLYSLMFKNLMVLSFQIALQWYLFSTLKPLPNLKLEGESHHT